MWNLTCHFLLIVTMTFYVNFIIGLIWITETLPVIKCKGQTANLTWLYIEEPGEEVTQLQWIFNRTELIAYFSLNQGFNVEPKYQGRVNQSGQTGILLHNISAKDSGNYTLYPLVKWEEKPNIQTVQLNVIEVVMESDCSCTALSALAEERNGEPYQIVVGSCILEIKASVCCPVGLVYQYCVNDPSKFCVPIWNLNKVIQSIAQSRIGNQRKDSAVNLDQHNITYVLLGIICVMLLILIIMGVIFFTVKKHHGMPCQDPRTTRNVEEVQLQDLQALQDTQQDDV